MRLVTIAHSTSLYCYCFFVFPGFGMVSVEPDTPISSHTGVGVAVAGTISVAIYHAIVTAGFNIYLLELLGLYFAAAVAVLACGPGVFSIDELIARRLEPDMEFSAELNEGFSKSGVLEEAVAGR